MALQGAKERNALDEEFQAGLAGVLLPALRDNELDVLNRVGAPGALPATIEPVRIGRVTADGAGPDCASGSARIDFTPFYGEAAAGPQTYFYKLVTGEGGGEGWRLALPGGPVRGGGIVMARRAGATVATLVVALSALAAALSVAPVAAQDGPDVDDVGNSLVATDESTGVPLGSEARPARPARAVASPHRAMWSTPSRGWHLRATPSGPTSAGASALEVRVSSSSGTRSPRRKRSWTGSRILSSGVGVLRMRPSTSWPM